MQIDFWEYIGQKLVYSLFYTNLEITQVPVYKLEIYFTKMDTSFRIFTSL